MLIKQGEIMFVQPYVNFDGCCEEAIAFYRKALGAEVVMLMRFKDFPVEPGSTANRPLPEFAERVMHACLRIGNSTICVSDGRNQGKATFRGIMLSLSVDHDAEAARIYAALSDGGTVTMPLARTFFSSSFGMVTDRFGVGWMVAVSDPAAAS